MKPISPKDAKLKKLASIPDEVIAAFNETIIAHMSQGQSCFTQKEVVQLAYSKLKASGSTITIQGIYNNHWLDVEPMYRKEGWKVEYDKPGYNEDYEASFTFVAPKGD